MIFIDLFGNPPSPELIAEGEELTEQLMQLPPEQRNDFIDQHAVYWGKLKEHYVKLSHGKCWYTEVKDIASSYHMDHFRPKKKPKELKKNCEIETATSTEAYWWLAFEWKNYRLSASVPNTSKHSYFPLKKGTNAITQGENVYKEHYALLDPTNKDDVALIAFGIDGKIYPACADTEQWKIQRVTLSKRVYNLDYPSLVDGRIEIQQKCRRKIQQIKNMQRKYAETSLTEFRDILKEYVLELKAMTQPDAELSAVARNYIQNDPEEFIRNIAC